MISRPNNKRAIFVQSYFLANSFLVGNWHICTYVSFCYVFCYHFECDCMLQCMWLYFYIWNWQTVWFWLAHCYKCVWHAATNSTVRLCIYWQTATYSTVRLCTAAYLTVRLCIYWHTATYLTMRLQCMYLAT
jgi:hypothetical protein